MKTAFSSLELNLGITERGILGSGGKKYLESWRVEISAFLFPEVIFWSSVPDKEVNFSLKNLW